MRPPLQVLAAELEGMRARHEAAAAAARAALDAAVVQEAERHADHIKVHGVCNSALETELFGCYAVNARWLLLCRIVTQRLHGWWCPEVRNKSLLQPSALAARNSCSKH